VCFGITGLYGWVCLDPRTGQVVDLIYVPVATTNLQAGVLRPAWLVNSSLEKFSASVRVVLDRFPFDRVSMRGNRDLEDSEWDDLSNEWDHAADELEEALRAVDPAAVANRDSFWMTFLDDVRMGDFMTSEMLEATSPALVGCDQALLCTRTMPRPSSNLSRPCTHIGPRGHETLTY
jgi:SUKH-4 immunity protein